MGYEMMTLFSLPLVLHERTPEAVAAAKKYLYYSSFGALCGLFGIFVLTPALTSAGFTAGGSLGEEVSGMTLAAVFVMLLGFGVKAGLFPLHGWLPTAHPVAPAPASAVLSGVITKAGVLGVIRTIYYTAGPETIRGSWVQWVYLALICVTIVMGSAMALQEDVLKKRLAYSTVSQVSYILLGLALLDAQGLTGALTHIVFHSVIKNALFMIAGIFIVKTGCTKGQRADRDGPQDAGYRLVLGHRIARSGRYPADERLCQQMAADDRRDGLGNGRIYLPCSCCADRFGTVDSWVPAAAGPARLFLRQGCQD